MKTPNLLDVPKMGLTKKEKLEDFKKCHRIGTHDTEDPTDKGRWCAALLTESLKRFGCYCDEAKAEQNDTDLLFYLMAGACRLMDESGLLIEGPTEIEAIRNLCRINNIPCTL